MDAELEKTVKQKRQLMDKLNTKIEDLLHQNKFHLRLGNRKEYQENCARIKNMTVEIQKMNKWVNERAYLATPRLS